MKILIVHPELPPAGGPEAICTEKLIRAVASSGAEVYVVTAPGSNIISAVSLYHVSDRGWVDEFLIEKCSRILHGYPESGWGWARSAALAVREVVKSQNIDVVYTRSMPFVVNLAVLFANLPRQCLWVAHFSDPWPTEGFFGDNGRSRRLMWHRRVINNVDAVTFPCARIAAFCKDKQWPASKRSILPTIIVPHLLPMLPTDSSTDPTRQSKKVFLHCGSFYGGRQPDNLLKAWARMVARHPELRHKVELRHIGPISKHFKQVASSEAVEDCAIQVGPCDYQQSLRAMSRASALVLIESVDMDVSIYLPSKFTDYLWACKPIVAISPRNGTIADILGSAYSLRADPWNLDEIETALFKAVESSENAEDKNHCLLASTRQLFRPEKVAQDFISAMEELQKQRDSGGSQLRAGQCPSNVI
jgi:glycosyltransferase involved in cell wall biosynthesis